MKIKLLIAFFYTSLSQLSIGQVTFQNLSLQNPDSNLIYIGIDNQIKISGITDFSKTIITTTGAFIGPSKNGIVIIRATNPGICQIFVKEKSLLKGAKKYFIKRIPDPEVQLGVYRNATLSISQIINSNKLNPVLPNCIVRVKFEVIRFTTTIISNNDTLYNGMKSKGNILSSDLITIIATLKSGDKLIFDEIYMKGPDDTHVDPFYIIVK